MTNEDHWQAVYESKEADSVSWFTPHLEESLRWIDSLDLPAAAQVIDVGAGASTLVDDLLARGLTASALDLSSQALFVSKTRLGSQAADVTWFEGDATTIKLPKAHYHLWHDRAVFHFLAEETARVRYVSQLERALTPGGHALIATFSTEGPEKCSGLPVVRYDLASLENALGSAFESVGHSLYTHKTPWGSTQSFLYGLFRFR